MNFWFESNTVKDLSHLEKCLGNNKLSKRMTKDFLINKIFAAIASASVEQLFSVFNLVHSKIRNSLRITEKAAKLSFRIST